MPDINVVRNDRKRRYEAWLHDQLVGFVKIRVRPEAVTFIHTEISPEHEGKGIGSTLARRALDDVRARGEKVIADCPFIAEYIRRHEEYADLLRL